MARYRRWRQCSRLLLQLETPGICFLSDGIDHEDLVRRLLLLTIGRRREMANKQSASKTPRRINAQLRLHQQPLVELLLRPHRRSSKAPGAWPRCSFTRRGQDPPCRPSLILNRTIISYLDGNQGSAGPLPSTPTSLDSCRYRAVARLVNACVTLWI